jgi:hypothetical protein
MALNRHVHYEPRAANMFLLVENEPERTCRTVCRDRNPVDTLVKQMQSEEHRHKYTPFLDCTGLPKGKGIR